MIWSYKKEALHKRFLQDEDIESSLYFKGVHEHRIFLDL